MKTVYCKAPVNSLDLSCRDNVETPANSVGSLRAQHLEGPGHWQIINDDCRQLALVRHWPNAQGVNTEETLAETASLAVLFAAAPELKTEVEADIHWIENLLSDINRGVFLRPERIEEGLRLRLVSLRAAIAKAEGRA